MRAVATVIPPPAKASGTQHGGRLALVEVVLVTLIWSSSFVGVKFALGYTGPFTVAGLRYLLAFALLVPWVWRGRAAVRGYPRALWTRFALMGLAQYTVGNGALFWALRTIPATAGSLVLSLVPILVLCLGILWLGERPRSLQLVGVGVAVGGSAWFFASGMEPMASVTFGALALALLAFAVFPVLARAVARGRTVGTVPLTAIPLGIGGAVLLVLALAVEGAPRMPASVWGVLVGLAVVNTLVAYLLYNHALQHLSAFEANVVLNLSPLGTAVLSTAFLGERLLPMQVVAMLAVVAGVTLVARRVRWV